MSQEVAVNLGIKPPKHGGTSVKNASPALSQERQAKNWYENGSSISRWRIYWERSSFYSEWIRG